MLDLTMFLMAGVIRLPVSLRPQIQKLLITTMKEQDKQKFDHLLIILNLPIHLD
jgi:hypothetical protein